MTDRKKSLLSSTFATTNRLFFRLYDLYFCITRRHWRYDFTSDAACESPTSARYTSVAILQTRQAIRALGPVHDLTFCDIGCGKGRVLFVAAEHPFRRVIGLELFPKLSAIAEQNLARRRAIGGRESVSIICTDATAFDYPAEPAVFYFFNPFPGPIFEKVLDQIETCCQGHLTLLIIVHPVTDAYTSVLRTRPYRLVRTLDCSFSRSLIYEHKW
jgi:SAM-dependent methyltransferase